MIKLDIRAALPLHGFSKLSPTGFNADDLLAALELSRNRPKRITRLDEAHVAFPYAFYVAKCDCCAVKFIAQLLRVLHP